MRNAYALIIVLTGLAAACGVVDDEAATGNGSAAIADVGTGPLPNVKFCPDVCIDVGCRLPNGTCTGSCNGCFCAQRGGTVDNSCLAGGAAETTPEGVDSASVILHQPCGPNVCTGSSHCCNASCGICAPPGGFCTQQI